MAPSSTSGIGPPRDAESAVEVVPGPGERQLAYGPLTITFDDRVLEPRPWTVAQAEWASELDATAGDGPLAELGTGAGHIGLATARWTGRRAVLVDEDAAACELARRNAVAAGLGDQVEVRQGPIDGAFGPEERFPLLLADPPYLPAGEVEERGEQDPAAAVDGGHDGFEAIRRFLDVAAAHLEVGGWLLLQVGGSEQAEWVPVVLEEGHGAGLEQVSWRAFGPDRAIVLLTRPVHPVHH